MRNKSVKIGLLASTIIAAPLLLSAANAQDKDIYFQLNGGIHETTNEDITGTISGTSIDTEYDADTGVFISGAVGKRLNDSFRIEGELGYRNNDASSLAGVPIDGDIEAWSLMGNGYYDFYTDSAYKPYIGAGLGIANVGSGDDETVFAYQAKAGVARALDNGSAIGAEIGYFGTNDIEINDGTDTIDVSYGGATASVFWRSSF